MAKVKKWALKLAKIKSNIILKIIIQFISLSLLIQDVDLSTKVEWSKALVVFPKDGVD